MKVFFVVPPERHFIESYVTKKLDKGREFRQKLGILWVAGHLREAGGITPRVIDSLADALDLDDLQTIISSELPDIVGFSVLTFNLLDCLEVSRMIKRVSPKTKIVFGGFHPSLYPLETLHLDGVDFVVFGEGEITFLELVKIIDTSPEGSGREADLAELDGIAWTDSDGRHHLNAPAKLPHPDRLDYLSMPAHDLVDIDKYTVVLSNESRVAAIQTSRGCPSRCTFCDIRLTKHRHRSTEHVLKELWMLKERGIREFFIVDDTFTINRKRVFELCRRMVDEKLNIPYKISSRVDRIDPELLEVLAESGCYNIHYGVESGTQRILDYMQKGVTLEQVKKAFDDTKKVGINRFAYLMMGVPTETREEIQRTIDLVDEIRPDYLNYSICTPFPKTYLYETARKDGDILEDYWLEFAKNPRQDFKIKVLNKHLTEPELRQLQDYALRKFYFSFDKIMREFKKTNSIKQLLTKARIGLRLITPRMS